MSPRKLGQQLAEQLHPAGLTVTRLNRCGFAISDRSRLLARVVLHTPRDVDRALAAVRTRHDLRGRV